MATKIKDGLFIGDAEASQDPEFIELNKITFVINCAGREMPNLWEQHGLHYLTFPWTSDPDCTLFDGGNVVIEQITSFIDEAAEKGDSVLVHSVLGTGRCIACVAAYLLFRHRWSFEKALDFLCNKRPDAAPNTGFVQQLYRLDLRLCERWYGENKEPTEDARIRHDQWIPLVPGGIPGRVEPRQNRNQGFTSAQGQRSEPHTPPPSSSSPSNAATAGKSAIADVIAEAAAGRFGGAPSAFPSLGRLTEVQEEEIVLVNSFLNSQPQIDALPPGRADYEDHVSKELHWIDRPRIDKLTAAGRLGRANDRRPQHMIPVSPRTGRAVPERPGNSSYNALSRGNKAATKATVPIGILKQAGERTERNAGGDRAQTNPRPASPAAGSTVRNLGTALSGDNAGAAVSGVGGKGGTHLAPSPLPSSLTHPAKVEDEVVVEDLSEPQSDRWSGGEGDQDTASGGETSSAGPAQGDGLSPENGTEASSSAEGKQATPAHSTRHRSAQSPATAVKTEHGRSSRQPPSPSGGVLTTGEQAFAFHGGVGHARDPAPPARQGERQAWDGSGSSSSSNAGAYFAVAKAGDSYGRGRTENPKGAVGANRSETEKQREKAQAGPSRTISNNPPSGGERNVTARSRADVKGRADIAAAAVGGWPETAAVLASPKQLRRGGSEASLHNALAFLSTKATNPSESKTRLPQAPVGRATDRGKSPSGDFPGPGWGPDDIRQDDAGASGKHPASIEIVTRPRGGEQGKGREETWGRRASEDGGGTLQQLAQTPNPQQRRLPSPRPQQGLGQGDRPQGSSDKGPLFPHARPSSAPSQRPDAPDSDSNSCSTNAQDDGRNGGNGAGGNGPIVPSSETGAPRLPASSSVGTRNQGYPAHGLMPSGSSVQMNASTSDRWGAATSRANESGRISTPRSSSQPQEDPAGGSGGGRRDCSTVVNGGGGKGGRRRGGGGGAGRLNASTEHGRVARTSSGEATGAEHRSGPDGGSSAGSLPRDISVPTSAATSPVARLSRTRGTGTPAPPPTSARSTGGGSPGGDHLRFHGSRRGFDSVTNATNASKPTATRIVRPSAGTLPLPSRIRSSYSRGGDVGDGGGKGSSSDAVRWANPAPRGRHGHGSVSSATYGSPGSKENRGGGSGGASSRIGKGFGDAYGQVPFDGRNQQIPGGRAGGAPIYRAGSPAPTRGRRASADAAAAATTAPPDPSRFLQQPQRSRGLEKKRHPSGVPPGFRGYMASSSGSSGAGGDAADSGRRGTTARRSHVPPPMTRDRGRRASGSGEHRRNDAAQKVAQASSAAAPYASSIADHSSGQRPSTSEGLAGGGGAERGRSPSPALRPSSASGRRRSSSPSPASLFTSKIDPSFDRPRWK